jgi:serine/threonine protein kinase
MGFLHAKNVLHRDLKPENTLVMSDIATIVPAHKNTTTTTTTTGTEGDSAGRADAAANTAATVTAATTAATAATAALSVKLCDFGLARFFSGTAEEHTMTGKIGTPAYMSPEMMAGVTTGLCW